MDFLASLHAMFVRVIRAEKLLRDQHANKLDKLLKLKLPHRDVRLLQARPLSMPTCPDQQLGVSLPLRLDAQSVAALTVHDQAVYNCINATK